MGEDFSVRVDKWLWAVRIFKTRSDAADACRTNRVLINGAFVKPSREIKVGDTVTVKKMPVTYTYRVAAMVSSRQPAKNVPDYVVNLTSQAELDKLHIPKLTVFAYNDENQRLKRPADTGDRFADGRDLPRRRFGNVRRFRIIFQYNKEELTCRSLRLPVTAVVFGLPAASRITVHLTLFRLFRSAWRARNILSSYSE